MLMKKSFTLCAMLGMTLMLSAQISNSPLIVGTDRLEMIPSEFTCEGHTPMLVLKNHSNSATEITVYNSNLNETACFSVPDQRSYECFQWYQENLWGPIGVHVVNSGMSSDPLWINDRTTGYNIDEVLDYLRSWNGYAEIIVVGGKRVVTTRGCYYSEVYGNRYPLNYYEYIEDEWFEHWFDYGYEDYGYTDIWGELQERKEVLTPEAISGLCFLSEYNDDTDLSVTQAFFNDDTNFEYCRPIVRISEFEREDKQYREHGQRLEYIGFDVCTGEGDIVRQFRLPDGYSMPNYIDLTAFSLSGVNYVAMDAEKNEDSYMMIYRADGTASASAPVLIQKMSSVSPTVPYRGQPVHIDLGEEAKSNCKVSVINANGREVNSIRIAEGNDSAEIRTDNLMQGLYVVIVKNGDHQHEATKIVVR